MTTLGSMIRQRRLHMGQTQEQLARITQISKPYLSNIETARTRNGPSDKVLRKLESALGFRPGELTSQAHLARTPVDVRDQLELRDAQVHKLSGMVKGLLAGTNAPAAPGEVTNVPNDDDLVLLASAGVLVPIINSVAAGYPHEFTDLDYPPSVADDYIRCPGLNDGQSFAARVVGDSMEPDYRQGDIVIFSPNLPAEDGNDCFVRFDADGGTTFKRFYQDDEFIIRLQPINNAYPSRTYPCEQITGLWPAIFRVQKLRDA